MKLESKTKVQIKTCQFGGAAYQVIGSIAPDQAESLQKQLAYASENQMDAVEIILNDYHTPERFADDLAACGTLEIPIGLRIQERGTDCYLDRQTGYAVLEGCIKCGLADFVDIEPEDSAMIERVKALIDSAGAKLILTRQDYRGVIDVETILKAAQEVEAFEPDLVRVLYLAVDDVDMLHIAQAAKKAKLEEKIQAPCCISAIVDAGVMVRLFAERCGNDFGSYPLYRKKADDMTFETLEEYYKLREVYTIDRSGEHGGVQV